MKKLLFIAIIAVLGCTALQAKNRIRIKRESWEVKASTRVPISTPLNLYYEGSTLFIHANIDLENIIIEVKDSFNKTIYLDLTSIYSGKYIFRRIYYRNKIRRKLYYRLFYIISLDICVYLRK